MCDKIGPEMTATEINQRRKARMNEWRKKLKQSAWIKPVIPMPFTKEEAKQLKEAADMIEQKAGCDER